MAWTAGVTKITGDLITAAIWNNYLGAAGSIEYLGETMELWTQCNAPTVSAGLEGIVPTIVCDDVGDIANVSFRIPDNFGTLLVAKFIVIPKATVGAANWDLAFYNASEGEAYNTHTATDAATTYNVTNQQYFGVDFSGIMTTIVAGDICAAQMNLQDGAHDFEAVGFYIKYSVG